MNGQAGRVSNDAIHGLNTDVRSRWFIWDQECIAAERAGRMRGIPASKTERRRIKSVVKPPKRGMATAPGEEAEEVEDEMEAHGPGDVSVARAAADGDGRDGGQGECREGDGRAGDAEFLVAGVVEESQHAAGQEVAGRHEDDRGLDLVEREGGGEGGRGDEPAEFGAKGGGEPAPAVVGAVEQAHGAGVARLGAGDQRSHGGGEAGETGKVSDRQERHVGRAAGGPSAPGLGER